MAKPRVVYQPGRGTAIEVNRGFYDRLGNHAEMRRLVDQFIVPSRSGRAWAVRAGQLCRIVVVEGPQVADFNAWNLHNPRERFWAARTKQLHRAHVTTYDRLWSCLPFLGWLMVEANGHNFPGACFLRKRHQPVAADG